ncbi:MAG: hypothetical protein JJ879_00610 [Sneathiella sp.]|nr:hypothetical protein [Sneathiella sp.]
MKVIFIILALSVLSGCASLDLFGVDLNYPLEGMEKRERGEAVADQLVNVGRPAAAIPIYQKLLLSLTELERGRLLTKLGQAQHLTGQYEPAIDSFLAASEVKSDICEVDLGLGKSLFALGRVSLAALRYEHCLKVEPTHAAAREELALAQIIQSGDPAALQILYETAAENPEDQRRQNNYALALVMVGDLAAARQLLERFAYAKDEAFTIRQNLALVMALQGDEEGALYVALMDLPPDQARSNLKIYRQLRQSRDLRAIKATLLGVGEIS